MQFQGHPLLFHPTKISNVVVEAADLPDGQEPVEADWKELKETGVKIDTKKYKGKH